MFAPLLLLRRPIAMVALAAIVTTGCADSEASLADAVVVSLPTDTLSGEELRGILILSPSMPGDDAAVGALSIWTDLALVTEAVAAGATLDDDATVAMAMRPAVMERAIQQYGETRAGSTRPTPAQVDSVARSTNVRVFRRYMIAPVDPTDTMRIRTEGTKLLQLKDQAVADGSPEAALRSMGDVAAGIQVTAPQAHSRDQLPEALAVSIWQLNDNELSDPIVGDGGIQLFQRVPSASAREAVAAWLGPVVQRRADAAFIDSIEASRGLTLAADAAARMRAAAVEPGTFATDAALVTWNGGDLSTEEARSWMALMPAPERARMQLASDTALSQTLGLMARREILFELAVAGGIDTSAVRELLEPRFREQISMLTSEARTVTDPTAWFHDVLSGRRQFRPLPGALPKLLRDRVAVVVDNEARVAATREAARTWQAPVASGQP